MGSEKIWDETYPMPVGDTCRVDPGYMQHLLSWIKGSRWEASMLCSKVCHDYEKQQECEGARRPVEFLMRHAFQVHAFMVQSGHSGPERWRDQRSVWREVLDVANPWFMEKHPRFGQMKNDATVEAFDFLAEFDRFAQDEDLQARGVVVMNSPEVEAWPLQALH